MTQSGLIGYTIWREDIFILVAAYFFSNIQASEKFVRLISSVILVSVKDMMLSTLRARAVAETQRGQFMSQLNV